MHNSPRGIFNSPWFLRLISLLLAILLYAYVNGTHNGVFRNTMQNDNDTVLTSSKTTTMTMPLNVNNEKNRFVVSGYPQYVKVKISGPSALVKSTKNTRNFKCYIDVADLGVGKHTVKVRESGLGSGLKYSFSPAKINVNVQPRRTVTMPVTIRLSNSTVAGDHTVGKPRATATSVQVTGSKKNVKRVAKIVAYVNVPHNASSAITRQCTLTALDSKGHVLNVVIVPSTITVTVPISSNDSSSSSSSASSDDNGPDSAFSSSSHARKNSSSSSSDTESSSSSSNSSSNQ